jgi:hypothetical protein
MTLENKYNVSRETLKTMVRDGIISCSVVRHYEVYDHYQKLKTECPTCTVNALIEKAANDMRESYENVKKILYTIGKKM